MFGREEKKPDLVLIIFGFIAFGVIMSVGFLIFKIFSQRTTTDSAKTTEGIATEQPETPPDFTPSLTSEEIEEKYNLAIDDLYQSVDSNDFAMPDLLLRVEEQMLKIKVPSSVRESYLEAVLEIVRMQNEISTKPTEDIKSNLLLLLKGLKI